MPQRAAHMMHGRSRSVTALVLACALALVLTTAVSPTPEARAEPTEPPPTRYLDPVFDDVTVTSDLNYGWGFDEDHEVVHLDLDLYEPTGDPLAARPVIVWIHGGSFKYGSKTGSFDVQQGRELARRGFVVASIDYRLSDTAVTADFNDDQSLQTMLRAHRDGRNAVAWLREHAAEHRLDPDVVLVSGYSAGGITAANMALLTDRDRGQGTDDDPSHVDGSIPYAGATLAGLTQPGEPPMLWFHGTADTVVPYSMALETHQAALADGIDSTFVSKAGATHDLSAYREEFRERIGRWAYDRWLAPVPSITDTIPGTLRAGEEAIVAVRGAGLSAPGHVTFDGEAIPHSVVHDGEVTIAPTAPTPGFYAVQAWTVSGVSAFDLLGRVAVGDPAVLDGDPQFADVPDSHVFEPSVRWAAATGLTTGRTDGTFGVTDGLSRQALVAMLHRSVGDAWLPPDWGCDVAPFPDVPADHPFCAPIDWAAEQGLVSGRADGTFDPTGIATRKVTARTLHAAAGGPDPGPDVPAFTDVPAGDPFATAIAWLRDAGMAQGHADGSFGPTAPVTRGAFVAMVHGVFRP